MIAHSYSSLNTWKKCPFQWEQQYKLKKFKGSFGEAAKAGVVIHEQIEKFIKGEREQLPSVLPKDDLVVKLRDMRVAGLDVVPEEALAVDRDFKPTKFFGKSVLLRGKVDVRWRIGDEVWAIDWKGGKRRPDDQKFQAKIYFAMLEAHYPGTSTHFVFDFLNNGRDKPLTADGTEKEEVLDLINEVESAERFDPRPSPLCRWCPVVTCEYNET